MPQISLSPNSTNAGEVVVEALFNNKSWTWTVLQHDTDLDQVLKDFQIEHLCSRSRHPAINFSFPVQTESSCWNTTELSLGRNVLDGHMKYIDKILVSPDGFLVTSSSSERTIRAWEKQNNTWSSTIISDDDCDFSGIVFPMMESICYFDNRTLYSKNDDGEWPKEGCNLPQNYFDIKDFDWFKSYITSAELTNSMEKILKKKWNFDDLFMVRGRLVVREKIDRKHFFR